MQIQNRIYQFTSLPLYLQDFLKTKGGAATYSYRAMAGKVKTISYSHLYQIFSGKRKMPIEIADEFAKKILKLNTRELRYFKTLIEVDYHLDTIDEDLDIEELENKLFALKPLRVEEVEFDEVIARPLTMILFVLLSRSGFKNIKFITPNLFLNEYSAEEISSSFKYLLDHHYIEMDREGNITHVVDFLMSKNDIPNQLIRNYHKEVSQYAINLIDKIEPEKREFQSYVINIDEATLPKAKELIRTFMSDFARLLDQASDQKKNATYNLNMQFFPIVRSTQE